MKQEVLVVGNSVKIFVELGWKPVYDSIYTIFGTAWNWHRNHPDGYSS